MKKLLLLAVALMVAACGSNSSSSSSSGSSNSGGTGYRSVAKATLNGTALSDPEGFTLYMFKSDSHGTPTCVDACETTWPPEKISGSKFPTVSGFSGNFGSVLRTDNTTQLTYDGWPLYRYSGDKSASDANGQGIGGVWFAVTTSTTENPGAGGGGADGTPAATSAPAATSDSGNNYPYN